MILLTKTDDLPLITNLNWTAVVEMSERFFTEASTILFADAVPGFPDLNLDAFTNSGLNLTTGLQNTWNLDLVKYDII